MIMLVDISACASEPAEIKGQTVTVTVNGFGAEYEIMDIDEDWVKLSRVNHKQQRETKLVRIEDIQGIQL